MNDAQYSHVLAPIQLGKLKVRNRIMLTTHNPKMNDERYLAYLEERVAGGVGLVGIPILHETVSSLAFVTTGVLNPDSAADLDGAPDPETEEGGAYFDEQLIPRLKSRADIIHAHGALCFGQIANRGAIRLPETFQPMVSPSGLPDEHVRVASHALTIDEISRVVRLFARSAARIKRAGLDGVEIHATHGYLIEQFLSPLTNRRDDAYGGNFDRRLRFLTDIIAAIRETCGPDFPIGMRISGYQLSEGGLSNEDIIRIVERVEHALVYVNVTAGTIGALQDGVVAAYVSSAYIPSGFNVDAAAELKSRVSIPVIVTGRINDPQQMDDIVANGQADMIGVTRALLADPEFITKMQSGEASGIQKCIGVNECHYPDRVSSCPVNPSAGREKELRIRLTEKPRKVLVIGGGPAGLEAARTAAKRGHSVTLVEKEARLGGKVAWLARDPSRREMITLIDTMVSELDARSVRILLDTEATPEFVESFGADAVVIASGAECVIPSLPGIDEVTCVSALDILKESAIPGQRVVVVGGLNDHIAPLAAADFLADQGKKVTLLTECLHPGQGLEASILHLLLKRLMAKDVEILALTELVRAGRSVTVNNVFTKKSETLVNIDAVVFAADRAPVKFPDITGEVYHIGDCLAPRRLVHATLDGRRIGVRL